MYYNFFALNSHIFFNVSKGFLIYLFNGEMKGQIRAISRHMEGQETSESDPCQGKIENNLAFCTHPDVRGFRGQTCVYTQ